MPELIQESSKRPSPPPPSPPRNPPPLPPALPLTAASFASGWERWEGFRFTFLRHFKRVDVDALTGVAQLLYSLILETPILGEEPLPGPETRWELVAVLSELRFLEGFLMSVFEEHQKSSLPPEVEELSLFAGGIASDLADIAHRLNEELAKWRN